MTKKEIKKLIKAYNKGIESYTKLLRQLIVKKEYNTYIEYDLINKPSKFHNNYYLKDTL